MEGIYFQDQAGRLLSRITKPELLSIEDKSIKNERYSNMRIKEVKFYENVEDDLLKFAVIISTYQGKLVFCKHRERDTYEAPGGHREPGEDILTTAKRELYEETGAVDFEIKPVCVYSVVRSDEKNEEFQEESFGMLYAADIKEFEGELHNEIEKIVITEKCPDNWTYPLIQPKLMEEVVRRKVFHNI